MPKDSKGNFHMNAQRAMAADKASAPPPSAAASPAPVMDDAGPSPMDDPEAMQCIDTLKAKGFTSDQVAQAMDQMDGGDMTAPLDEASPSTDGY